MKINNHENRIIIYLIFNVFINHFTKHKFMVLLLSVLKKIRISAIIGCRHILPIAKLFKKCKYFQRYGNFKLKIAKTNVYKNPPFLLFILIKNLYFYQILHKSSLSFSEYLSVSVYQYKNP